MGFEEIGEAGFGAGGLIKEWERPPRSWNRLRDAFAVLLCLDLNTDEGRAFFLSFNNSGGVAVDKEQVVRLTETLPQGKFSNSHSVAGVYVRVGPVLDEPSGRHEHAVYGLASFLFRGQICVLGLGHQCMTERGALPAVARKS